MLYKKKMRVVAADYYALFIRVYRYEMLRYYYRRLNGATHLKETVDKCHLSDTHLKNKDLSNHQAAQTFKLNFC